MRMPYRTFMSTLGDASRRSKVCDDIVAIIFAHANKLAAFNAVHTAVASTACFVRNDAYI